MIRGLFTVALAMVVGCKGVASDEAARLAYEGLDPAIAQTLQLGLDGFNAADSANIPTQSADGAEAGTIVVDGQADQGSSDNKGLRLDVVLTDWSAGDVTTSDDETLVVAYATEEGAPLDVDLSLKDMPAGTIDGTIVGTVLMTGDLEGTLDLDLALAGETEDDGSGGAQRAAGTIVVSGTATSEYGVFNVDVTL